MEICPRCRSTLHGAAELCPACGSSVGLSADDFLSDLLAPPFAETETEAETESRSASAVWAEHDLSERPRRTGHDGAVRSIDAASYSPVPERAPNDILGGLPTRAVPALSSRVSADIEVGPSRHHQLVSAALGILALVVFIGGVTATPFLDGNGSVSAGQGPGSADTTLDPDIPADDMTADNLTADGTATTDTAAVRRSLVTVTYQGCDAAPVVHGGMLVTNDSTVVVPIPTDPPTADVVVTTARGDIGGTIVGWGVNDRLAIVQLVQAAADPPLTWASANRVNPGDGLSLMSLQSGTWTASTVIAAGVDRNGNGAMSRIRVAEGTLTDVSIALDADGFAVGVVRPGDTTAIAASDEVRPTLAAFLTNGGWSPSTCAVPSPPGAQPGAE